MLEVRDLCAGYYRDLDVLRGVSVGARPGEVTAILGANGVGKSTLLKAIFGFLTPTAGHVLLDGGEITGTPPHRMVDRGVAYRPQQPGIFAEMTVEENITIGAWTFRRDGGRIRRKLEESYARFPVLGPPAKPGEGTVRRPAPDGGARPGAHDRSAVSPRRRADGGRRAGYRGGRLRDADRLRGDGVGIVLVDQDIRRALQVADYVYVIDLGQNRLEGAPTELGDIEEVFWQTSSSARES